ncbi:MAG: RDD family protein [Pedobacter sp.]|nr:MAG: RDD family protein [Pedobacter sp.]
MDTIKVGTSQNVAIDYPVAGLGERIAARLIDLAVFFVIYILFIILSLAATFSQAGIVVVVLIWAYFASYVFYNLIFEIFMNGQSIGKRIMKIKVISLDGAQASLGQYFIRWIFRLVDFLLTAQVGGLVSIAVTENKQRIGDIVAGTTVIKTVPRTKIGHIAFSPTETDEAYDPTFKTVHLLNDRDIELVHEVIITYYKTRNYELIEQMSVKIAEHIGIVKPNDMNGLDFLNTVVKDYNHITSSAI